MGRKNLNSISKIECCVPVFEVSDVVRTETDTPCRLKGCELIRLRRKYETDDTVLGIK